MAIADPRTSIRVLNYGEGPPDDGREREWDVCPDCGGKRWQLVIVPDRFHCDRCEKSSRGPNTEAPVVEPEQMGLIGSFVDESAGSHVEVTDGRRTFGADDFERPPLDEADAWIADETPDE